MAQRILELTLVSASKLKDVNFISDMEVYAVASLNGDPRTRQQTQTDREGEMDPTWEETVWFAVPPTAAAASATGAYLHVLLCTERFFGDDRDVGEVFVPLAELLAGACGGATPPRCASYPVRKVQCSKRRGKLSVSYRLGPVMVPLHQNSGCWNDPYPLPPWGFYPPTYYMQEGQQAAVPRYPPAGIRMPPAFRPAGGGAAATSAGTKNIMKNSSSALGFGAGLLAGGFERMLFGDMPSSDMAAHKSW
ncbi:hypothetical protein QYE76_038870 [Lolium multiflorum]|uniref:C2 domain-containing protein n=1 Tax=Lolium multiflorum TaxID=4521 RepID=A0AAD8T9Z1_LOLMU|nr:hypothetical protein QYE76_038870 [Lolium multiflorum]